MIIAFTRSTRHGTICSSALRSMGFVSVIILSARFVLGLPSKARGAASSEAHQVLAQLFTPSASVELTPEQLRTLRSLGYIR